MKQGSAPGIIKNTKRALGLYMYILFVSNAYVIRIFLFIFSPRNNCSSCYMLTARNTSFKNCIHVLYVERKQKRPSTFYVFIPVKPWWRRRAGNNKFCNIRTRGNGGDILVRTRVRTHTAAGHGVVDGRSGEASGLDVVTEIYDCGKIGEKK